MLVIKPVDTALQLLRESFASIGLDRISTRLGIALLVASSLFFAANFADKAWVSYQVSQQKQQLIAQIQLAKDQINTYTGELKYMQSRPYYVDAARQFGFVQAGDVPVSISTLAPVATQQTAPEASHLTRSATIKPEQHGSFLGGLLQALVPGF